MEDNKLVPQQEFTSNFRPFKEGEGPAENETVWLYNNLNKFIALGCRIYIPNEEGGWYYAISNGGIYNEGGKIVAECEADDDYEFTHWCPLPALPL